MILQICGLTCVFLSLICAYYSKMCYDYGRSKASSRLMVTGFILAVIASIVGILT